MNKDNIEYILDCYGLHKILSDHGLTKINVLEILDDLNYINLQKYLDPEEEVNEYE